MVLKAQAVPDVAVRQAQSSQLGALSFSWDEFMWLKPPLRQGQRRADRG